MHKGMYVECLSGPEIRFALMLCSVCLAETDSSRSGLARESRLRALSH